MKWIGATNTFVRAPFVVEGVLIGLAGAVIPLVCFFFLYQKGIVLAMSRCGVLSGFMHFLPVGQLYKVLLPVALFLGAGIGFFGSFFTIRRQLKV